MIVINGKDGFVAPSTVELNKAVLENINNLKGTDYNELLELSTDTEIFVDSINRTQSTLMSELQSAWQSPFNFLKEQEWQIQHAISPTYGSIKDNFKDLCTGLFLEETATAGVINLHFDTLVDWGKDVVDADLSPIQKRNRELLNEAFKMSDGCGIHHEGDLAFNYTTNVDTITHEFRYTNTTTYTNLDLEVSLYIKPTSFAPLFQDVKKLISERMEEINTIGINFYSEALINSQDFNQCYDIVIRSKLEGESATAYSSATKVATPNQRFFSSGSINIVIGASGLKNE